MVAYYFLLRIIFTQIFYGRLYKNQSQKNNYVLCSLTLIDFLATFFEKEENYVAKFISHIAILCIIGTIFHALLIKFKDLEM